MAKTLCDCRELANGSLAAGHKERSPFADVGRASEVARQRRFKWLVVQVAELFRGRPQRAALDTLH